MSSLSLQGEQNENPYIGNVHELANSIVSVNAYGVLGRTRFPLAFRFYKSQGRLKPGDGYQTKPQIAVDLIEALQTQGFQFSLVLADSLYSECHDFTHGARFDKDTPPREGFTPKSSLDHRTRPIPITGSLVLPLLDVPDETERDDTWRARAPWKRGRPVR